VTVLVQETQVRRQPKFYAAPAGKASLGDKFESQGVKDGWHKVEGKLSGYIHESALTAKKVRLGAASSVGAGEASAEEITLAGKGFNAQVEKSYSQKHAGANFAGVNAMERRSAREPELMDFARTGALIPEGAK
jgi:hypothetical protein